MLMYHFHIHRDLRYAYTEVSYAFSFYECCSRTGASELITFNIGEYLKEKWKIESLFSQQVPILGRLNLTLNPNEVVAIVWT